VKTIAITSKLHEQVEQTKANFKHRNNSKQRFLQKKKEIAII